MVPIPVQRRFVSLFAGPLEVLGTGCVPVVFLPTVRSLANDFGATAKTTLSFSEPLQPQSALGRIDFLVTPVISMGQLVEI
jgi:hypothetical protein